MPKTVTLTPFKIPKVKGDSPQNKYAGTELTNVEVELAYSWSEFKAAVAKGDEEAVEIFRKYCSPALSAGKADAIKKHVDTQEGKEPGRRGREPVGVSTDLLSD
jgi:hypothetical protein